MTDDDAKDLNIHFAIERMVRTFCMRGMTRAQVLAELCSGNESFAPGLQAICEMLSITRAELNERISAFVENEREEEKERAAIAEACRAEEGVL